MADDSIFELIRQHHGPRPWGRVLDAGTGPTSLAWITSLPADEWCAVTFSESDARSLAESVPTAARSRGRVLAGDWTDPSFRSGERYDTVLADYLLGAIDAYTPYRERELIARLAELVGSRLYLVGKEPLPRRLSDAMLGEVPDARWVVEIENLRDACITLAGHRCHREIPLDWTTTALEGAGLEIEATWTLGILYDASHLKAQLEVCRRKLPWVEERKLARGLEARIRRLQRAVESLGPRRIPLGFDYVISAVPKSR